MSFVGWAGHLPGLDHKRKELTRHEGGYEEVTILDPYYLLLKALKALPILQSRVSV